MLDANKNFTQYQGHYTTRKVEKDKKNCAKEKVNDKKIGNI